MTLFFGVLHAAIDSSLYGSQGAHAFFDVATTVGWCLSTLPMRCLCLPFVSTHLGVSITTGRLCPVARCPDRCTLRCVCASCCLYSSQRLHASFCRLVFTRLLVSLQLLASPRLLLLPGVYTPLGVLMPFGVSTLAACCFVSTPILRDVTSSGIYIIQDYTYP